MTPTNTKYLLLVAALLQITWGLVPSASKFVIDEIPVELYISIRWTISGFIFLIFLTLTRSLKAIDLKDALGISILGILGYGLASLGTLYGLQLGGVSNFALMSALSPIVVSGVSIFLLSETPNRRFYIALPICVFGLMCLVFGKYQTSSFQIAIGSAVLVLIGFTLEAVVFAFSKRFKAKVGIAQYLAISQLAAATIFWLLQVSYFHQISTLPQLTVKGVSAALFVSIVACVLCYAILYWLLRYIDGHRLALFDALHALSACTMGYLLFRDPLTGMMGLGGLLILIGLVLGNLKKA